MNVIGLKMKKSQKLIATKFKFLMSYIFEILLSKLNLFPC